MRTLGLGPVTVDLYSGQVDGVGTTHRLSELEREFLAYVARRPGQTVSRDQLYRDVWGYGGAVVSRAVDSTVARLRQKIEKDPSKAELLVTDVGGYKLVP